MKTKLQLLTDFLTQEVAWNMGSEYPWQGMALMDAEFLEKLTFLAAHAEYSAIKKFIEETENAL